METRFLSLIEERFWPKGGRRDIWMLIDGARDRKIFGMLLDSYLTYACLYSGPIAPELEIAAPYLVQLEFEDRYSRRLIENAWGNSWGIFLKCDAGLEALRRHLARFLSVRDTAGMPLIFRYYDPRVFRVYLPTCRDDEVRAFFGGSGIECFWTEDRNPEAMLEFRLDREKLVRHAFSLTDGQQPPVSATVPATRGSFASRPGTLTIRQEQMSAFRNADIENFEEWMLVHLKKFFPKQSHVAGDQRLRDTIRCGIRSSAAYGITAKRDVCKYIDLMVLFGRDFDTDRTYPWAGELLSQPGNPQAKIKALMDSAMLHLRQV